MSFDRHATLAERIATARWWIAFFDRCAELGKCHPHRHDGLRDELRMLEEIQRAERRARRAKPSDRVAVSARAVAEDACV